MARVYKSPLSMVKAITRPFKPNNPQFNAKKYGRYFDEYGNIIDPTIFDVARKYENSRGANSGYIPYPEYQPYQDMRVLGFTPDGFEGDANEYLANDYNRRWGEFEIPANDILHYNGSLKDAQRYANEKQSEVRWNNPRGKGAGYLRPSPNESGIGLDENPEQLDELAKAWGWK